MGMRRSQPARSRVACVTARVVVVLRAMWGTGEGRFTFAVIGVWLLVAGVSMMWTPQPLWATDGFQPWRGPSPAHLLGTDGTGADMLSWLMAGSATNLLIVVLTVALTATLGLCLVAAMTSESPLVCQPAVVAVDALISLPTVLLALILAVPLGPGIAVIVLACGFGYALNLARIVRPTAVMASRSGYAQAALAHGAPWHRVFLAHVMPNVMPLACVQLSMSAATSVLAESGLTYLGIGVPSGVPSWGRSLANSVTFINVFPLSVLWPGLIVTLAVTALNLLGDLLRDHADPVANPALRRLS